jgi:putative membrane protein
MSRERHILRGALAGTVGGLVASWVMNEFMGGTGKRLQKAVQTDEQNQADEVREANKSQPQEDATMKVADEIVKNATGGRHLSWSGKERGGPVVHYAFGAIMGGIYGGLAECAPGIAAGSGISFGTVLFTGADLFAVPALGLSANPAQQPASKLASPFVAHIVYGVTTDLVRRLLR